MSYFGSKRPDVIVFGWMMDLGLKNEELLIYAFIHDYTWKIEVGNLPNLTVESIASKLYMSRTVVRNRIEKLLAKNLITGDLKAVYSNE